MQLFLFLFPQIIYQVFLFTFDALPLLIRGYWFQTVPSVNGKKGGGHVDYTTTKTISS